jgi:hypothetical protein
MLPLRHLYMHVCICRLYAENDDTGEADANGVKPTVETKAKRLRGNCRMY